MTSLQQNSEIQLEENLIIFNSINLTQVTKQQRLSLFYPTIPVVGAPAPDAVLNTMLETGGWRILKECKPVINRTGSTIVFLLVKLT